MEDFMHSFLYVSRPFPWVHSHLGISCISHTGPTLGQLPGSPQHKPCPKAGPHALWWPPVGLQACAQTTWASPSGPIHALLWPQRVWRRSVTAGDP